MTEASHDVRPISSDRGAGAGGGGQGGAIAPPTFCLKGMNMPVSPPKFWQSLGISTCLPPQEKNRSRAPVFRPGYSYKVT